LVLVLRAAKAKARRTRGINRVKVGSLDRRLHAPQNTALTTLANAQQQCNGVAEKRSYTDILNESFVSFRFVSFRLAASSACHECRVLDVALGL
jgi:hypothetical protein